MNRLCSLSIACLYISLLAGCEPTGSSTSNRSGGTGTNPAGDTLSTGPSNGSGGTGANPAGGTLSTGSTNGDDLTTVLINLGGFTSVPDQIVSFAVTIESVALRSTQADVQLLSDGPRRFELTRQSFRLEPLAFHKVPRGNYNAIVITVSDPTVSFIDVAGVLHHVSGSSVPSTQVVELPLSVGSAPICFQLRVLSDSVAFNEGEAIDLTPHFTGSAFDVQNGVGIINDLVGRATSVGASSFGIDFGDGASEDLVLETRSYTEFHGLNGLDALTDAATIRVNAVFFDDGSLRANEIELENDSKGATVLEGISLAVAPSQIRLLVREVHSPHSIGDLPAIGVEASVNLNASTQFKVESKNVDLTNLDFSPKFDALTIAPGQNVRAGGAGPSTTITADQVKLDEQSIEGVAGALRPGLISNQSFFSLTLSPDSALAKISGSDSVLVVVQPSTFIDTEDWFAPCLSCVPGKHARVYGLLFNSGGEYRLVASEVSTN